MGGLGGPKIMFDEQKDDFDAFIDRFEGLATCQKLPKDQWAIYLCTLLQGKALEVNHRMKTVDTNDFEKVKECLMLQKFWLTKEGFRQKI